MPTLSEILSGAVRTRMPPTTTESGGTVLAIPPQFQPQYRGPPPRWTPRPTEPFGGLTGTDWKQPGTPQETSYTSIGPPEGFLQQLHLLGRRRFSPVMQEAAYPTMDAPRELFPNG